MKKYEDLKNEALEVCQSRDHVMTEFQETQAGNLALSRCQECAAWVLVLTKPMPNELSVSGSALAINCKK